MKRKHDELEVGQVVPFGHGGAGQYTSHPVGLFVALAILTLALIALPEARWFLAGALVFGGLLGLILYLRHR